MALVLQANAQMVPKIPSCYCKLLIQPSRFKLSKFISERHLNFVTTRLLLTPSKFSGSYLKSDCLKGQWIAVKLLSQLLTFSAGSVPDGVTGIFQ